MVFSAGRRLEDSSPKSYIKDGMKCSGYTHREGKEYCKKPFKKQDGTNGCHEVGTIYEGSTCVEWGEEKVKIPVSVTNHSEVTNPEYLKVQSELEHAQSKKYQFKNALDALLATRKVEVINLTKSLKMKWSQVEQNWVNKQQELLR